MLGSLLLPLLILPSVVITSWPTHIASGSTGCVHDALCKIAPNHADGFVCPARTSGGSNQPLAGSTQPSVCDALNVHYDRWEAETKVLFHLFKEVGKILEAAQVGQNATSQLLAELDTLKGCQAVSAAVQVGQVLMFIGYLLTNSVVYMVKHCQKARERKQNQEFELIEQKLQARKAKRRAAAASAKSAPGPSQE